MVDQWKHKDTAVCPHCRTSLMEDGRCPAAPEGNWKCGREYHDPNNMHENCIVCTEIPPSELRASPAYGGPYGGPPSDYAQGLATAYGCPPDEYYDVYFACPKGTQKIPVLRALRELLGGSLDAAHNAYTMATTFNLQIGNQLDKWVAEEMKKKLEAAGCIVTLT